MTAFCLLIACGKIDNPQSLDEPQSIEGDSYLASKTAIIRTIRADGGNQSKGAVIFEEFNYKFELIAGLGRIGLCPWHREKGYWDDTYTNQSTAGWRSIGSVKDLSQITQKSSLGDGKTIETYPNGRNWVKFTADIQPNYGYTGCFQATDGSLLYMRLLITGYTLTKNGDLETITVNYQLF